MSGTVWYGARAGGIVAYLLLSGSVALGLLMASKQRLQWPRFAVEELHRWVSLLTGWFVALHGAALLLDTVVPFSFGQELIPFTASYKPFATGLGVVTAEVVAAVGLSNALRRRLPHRLWRGIHYATLVTWPLATVHVLLAGTDRHEVWLIALAGLAVWAVALCGVVRVSRTTPTTA